MTDIIQAYSELKAENAARDVRHAQVSAVRRGDVHEVMPGLFPDNLPKQVTANMVNIASRQLGEQLGGLPDFSCKSGRHKSDRAKTAAEKRTQIVNGFVELSRLQTQMHGGGDRYLSFGALPVVVEPDFEMMSPVFRVDSPVGAYWHTDLYGRVVHYYKCWYDTAGSLAAKFPQHADEILGRTAYSNGESSQTLEVVLCKDKYADTLFLPSKNLVLATAANPMKKTPVFIAEMPKWDDEVRGQFDEMIWVQLFRARLSALILEGAWEAVNAPVAVPTDVNHLPTGPRSIIHTNNPEGIRRIGIDLPPAAFAESANLANEERLAARFPEAMTGNLNASVITGQGIGALLSTVDTQIQVAQSLFAQTLQDAASFALEMDEKLFGQVEKSAKGRAQGAQYSIRYTPEKDIKGDYEVECTYGFASGMDANRGLIFMLQAQGAGLLSRETIMDQLASQFGINSSEEMARMDIESLQAALLSGVQGLGATFPQLAQMGQDPRQALRQVATVADQRLKGVPIHEAIIKAFEPTPEEQAAAEQQAQDPLAALMGGGPAGAPAPAGGGPQDLQMMLANLSSSGEANMQNSISRMIPTAG
ncbi:hypothetical protein [Jiangella anatolica]|uniref:Phage portal protein n=1 Tax=Jiangella anatolica TaxID=2670374 RepID=A0A2W2C7I1_9ACTN|nr:hypothetical protein [Jiangella anatolica]PZF84169.1 hypothetical protein C1I92_09980 [Jiangella anatolica]